MARCVKAVLAFVEHPAVEGSRLYGPDVNLPGIGLALDQLPDIGVGPKALLVHAVEMFTADRSSAMNALSPFTALDSWIAVSTSQCHYYVGYG